jgi:hypothetical protein
MDSSVVTTIAAVTGSMVGASASIATTWISMRSQAIRANAEWRLRERQRLYKEFITEASRLAVEARGHSLEGLDRLAALYGVLNRIRLISGDDVLSKAEDFCRRIVELYWQPNMTLEEFRVAYEADRLDSLKEFSTACRKELLAISAIT